MNQKLTALILLLFLGRTAGGWAAEKTFDGWKEGVIWVVRPGSSLQASAKGASFGFDLDFAMQGALALADRSLVLSTEPKGLRLKMEEPQPLLQPRIENGEIFFALGSDAKTNIGKGTPIESGGTTTKIMVRQLDQLALYAVSPDLKTVLQLWSGTVDYKIKLRSADIYELCENVEVSVGVKKFEAKDLPKGLVLDHLDELGDVVIKGLDPQKKPFVHRYTFDQASAEVRLNEALQMIFPDRKKAEKAAASKEVEKDKAEENPDES